MFNAWDPFPINELQAYAGRGRMQMVSWKPVLWDHAKTKRESLAVECTKVDSVELDKLVEHDLFAIGGPTQKVRMSKAQEHPVV